MLLLMILILGVSLLWALFIIARSDRIAAWLTKEDDDKLVEVSSSVCIEDIMVVAFSCIGLFVIVTAIPNLIQYLAFFRPGGDSFAKFAQQLFRIIAPILQITLGIWLFAGAKGIVKFWKKIRS